MTWPRTMADLANLALAAVGVAQGFVYIGLALLLVAFIWWIFRVQRSPDASIYDTIRGVLLLAFVVAVALAFIPVVRVIRQLTS